MGDNYNGNGHIMALETMKEYYTRKYAETKDEAYLALIEILGGRK